MSMKIAQTMTTLSEENRDLKLALRLLLKYEIQSLLERLSELGDNSLLLLSNAMEGTCSHFATPSAEKFLNNFGSTYNMNLKDTFHKFCCSSDRVCSQNHGDPGTKFLQAQQGGVYSSGQSVMSQPQAISAAQVPGNWNSTMTTMASETGLEQQLQNIQSFSANIQQQLHKVSKQPQQLLISGMRYSPYHTNIKGTQKEGSENVPQHVKERKARNACRHFIQKGYCWQGSLCAFLHTKDPEVLRNCGATNVSFSADSSQSPSEGDSAEQAEVVEKSMNS